MWFVYILQSQKDQNWFYKGSTNNIERRFSEHENGDVQSTKAYRPFKLVYFEAYLSQNAALNREYSIKQSGSVWKPLMDRIKNSLLDNPK